MPLQPVSSERNHQVADKFRKVSCLNDANLHVVNFLDVTFDLNNGKFKRSSSDYSIRSHQIFETLQWQPIKTILDKRELLLMFIIIKGKAPNYLTMAIIKNRNGESGNGEYRGTEEYRGISGNGGISGNIIFPHIF